MCELRDQSRPTECDGIGEYFAIDQAEEAIVVEVLPREFACDESFRQSILPQAKWQQCCLDELADQQYQRCQ